MTIPISGSEETLVLAGLKTQLRRVEYRYPQAQAWMQDNGAFVPILSHDPLHHGTGLHCPYFPTAEDGTAKTFLEPYGRPAIPITVTRLRIERLSDIRQEDIVAEGLPGTPNDPSVGSFTHWIHHWNRRYPNMPHDSDPWVWVIEFALQPDNQ